MPADLLNHIHSTIQPNDHPYMNGAWAPNHEEYNSMDMEVIGKIPKNIGGVNTRAAKKLKTP